LDGGHIPISLWQLLARVSITAVLSGSIFPAIFSCAILVCSRACGRLLGSWVQLRNGTCWKPGSMKVTADLGSSCYWYQGLCVVVGYTVGHACVSVIDGVHVKVPWLALVVHFSALRVT